MCILQFNASKQCVIFTQPGPPNHGTFPTSKVPTKLLRILNFSFEVCIIAPLVYLLDIRPEVFHSAKSSALFTSLTVKIGLGLERSKGL